MSADAFGCWLEQQSDERVYSPGWAALSAQVAGRDVQLHCPFHSALLCVITPNAVQTVPVCCVWSCPQDFGAIRVSTLTLVDLAGSERIAKVPPPLLALVSMRIACDPSKLCHLEVELDQVWCLLGCGGMCLTVVFALLAQTGAEGQRMKEGAAINKSLLTLGTVINKLSEGVQAAGESAQDCPWCSSCGSCGRQRWQACH
jgi:hypothetical protein